MPGTRAAVVPRGTCVADFDRVHREFLALAAASLASLYACERLDATLEPRTPAASDEPPECVVDDDCGLMPPLMTCCGECDPAPPFEPVPRTAIDARLIELEHACAEHAPVCEPPVCETVPPGCIARAVCVRGRCRVVESGCSALVADHALDATCPGSLPSTFAWSLIGTSSALPTMQ
jgi:hypothetical protein